FLAFRSSPTQVPCPGWSRRKFPSPPLLPKEHRGEWALVLRGVDEQGRQLVVSMGINVRDEDPSASHHRHARLRRNVQKETKCNLTRVARSARIFGDRAVDHGPCCGEFCSRHEMRQMWQNVTDARSKTPHSSVGGASV